MQQSVYAIPSRKLASLRIGKVAKDACTSGFKKLKLGGLRVWQVTKKVSVYCGKKLKAFGLWAWEVLKKNMAAIKAERAARKASRLPSSKKTTQMRAGAKVALVVTSLTIAGALVIIFWVGGLRSDATGVGVVLLWLLITPILVFGAIGIGYGVWRKKISSRNLLWAIAILLPLLVIGCI